MADGTQSPDFSDPHGNQEEHDMYIAQLQEVFQSCSQTGADSLTRDELFTLCDKLQLQDQAQYLVEEMLKDKQQVEFHEFKDTFVTILCEMMPKEMSSDEETEVESMLDTARSTDGLTTMEHSVMEEEGEDEEDGDDEEDEEEVEDEERHEEEDEESDGKGHEDEEETDDDTQVKREMSPKYVVGKKQYGRRSLPVAADELASLADDEEDIEVASSTQSLKRSLIVDEMTDTEEDSDSNRKHRKRDEGKDGGAKGTETFEGEGQLNQPLSGIEGIAEEERYVRGIWNNLGVGQNGYINIEELARVCNLIGMEKMADSELRQLFDKLDADGDGRVSFQEFLSEMFQHSVPSSSTPGTHLNPNPAPSRSLGTTPTRALSAQKKLKYPGGEDRTTPSIVQGAGITGLFSVLDPERTGFAKPDSIIDLWEKCNVPNGADILLGLGFDLTSKVNLSELSAALEQELVSVEEQSLVYQAAAVTFQQEIRVLKSSLEQAVWAKDKLKLDLSEANARNNLLAKEVDERHASMERSSESKLLSIEKKYQDQVRNLQAELDKERENFSMSSALNTQRIQADMEELRQEELRLREQLTAAQKEIEKMARDLDETTYDLEESQKHNARLQRELDNLDQMNKKLTDFENRGLLDPEQQKFAEEKLQRLEQENKDLRDTTDELTAELETLKQQMTPSRRLGLGAGEGEEEEVHVRIRKDGSLISDYIKPKVIRRESFSSVEYSDDDAAVLGSIHTPAKREEDSISLGSDRETVAQLKADLQQLREQFEVEKKEIEQGYRLEITDIEERQDREKGELLAYLEREKVKLAEEFDRLQHQALAELAKDLQTNFVHEKEDLIQKYETEKNHTDQTHAAEKQKLIQRMTAVHEEDLQARIKDVTAKAEEEQYKLNETIQEKESKLEGVKQHLEELQEKAKRQKEDIDQLHHRHKLEMADMMGNHKEKLRQMEIEKREIEQKQKHKFTDEEDNFRRAKSKLEDEIERQHNEISELKKQLSEMELKHKQVLSEGEVKTRGEKLELTNQMEKLRQDIRELQRSKAESLVEVRQQREELEEAFRQEKLELREVYEARLQEEEQKLEQAKKERENILQGGLNNLHGCLRDDFLRLVSERVEEEMGRELKVLRSSTEAQQHLLQQHIDTKESELSHIFEREKTELVEKYESEIRQLREQLHELEDKLVEERESLAQRYEEEKSSIEEQLALQLRDELEEEFVQQMEEIKEAFDDERRESEAQTKLLRDELDDLQEALAREGKNKKKYDELKKAHAKMQQEQKQMQKSLADTESQLRETKLSLEARIDELLAEKEGAVQAVRAQVVETAKLSGKDKAAYEMVSIEKDALEKRVGQLTQEVTCLHDNIETQQKQIETLEREKIELSNQLQAQSPTRVHLHPPIPEHAQRAINELTKEKSELNERLIDTETRLAELEDMAKKYSYLQKKYEDVSRDRDKATNLVKSMKEQLNQANVASKEDNQDKGHLAAVLEEKRQLESQLQLVSDKLFEATTNFVVSQSAHIRELQQWKEQSNNMVDLQKYTKLQIDLVDNQRTLRDLQEALSNKEEVTGKEIKETLEKHTVEVKGLENQKVVLERQLRTLQQILDGQIDKLKNQYEASEKRNALLVDLYKENADLMNSLYRVEEQKKDAVARCYKLEDQCNNLRRMLKRLAKVAVT